VEYWNERYLVTQPSWFCVYNCPTEDTHEEIIRTTNAQILTRSVEDTVAGKKSTAWRREFRSLLSIDTSIYSSLHSTRSPSTPPCTTPSPLFSHLPLPIPHMRQDNPCRLLRTMLPPNRLHKIPFRIHQIKINTMIDQIVLSLLHSLWRREIHSILLTDILNLLPSSCEADYRGVEFGEVGGEHAWCVPCWVAGYEEREERWEGGGT
jgi:hypothetical protein